MKEGLHIRFLKYLEKENAMFSDINAAVFFFDENNNHKIFENELDVDLFLQSLNEIELIWHRETNTAGIRDKTKEIILKVRLLPKGIDYLSIHRNKRNVKIYNAATMFLLLVSIFLSYRSIRISTGNNKVYDFTPINKTEKNAIAR